MGGISITLNQEHWDLGADEVFTFGRDETCTAALSPEDLGISRVAGVVEAHSNTWWLVNHSSSRPLHLVDEIGMRSVLGPGQRTAISSAMTVIVEGRVHRHALAVRPAVVTPPGRPIAGVADSRNTVTADDEILEAEDRLALTALFAGYLRPFPRYNPHPHSYSEAAAALKWPRTTLVKRVERLRGRLTDAGVPNLLGENAMEALAEWALTTRVVTKDDLDKLP